MGWFVHLGNSRPSKLDKAPTPQTQGQVIRWPRFYDFLLWVVTHGREQALRQRLADVARLQPGEAVLDVGCGTGTMALEARERVGTTARVSGIEPSVRMIAYARRKAERADLSVDFQPGVIEQLAFPNQSFDVVLCIIVLHHLPDDLKHRGLAEIARVLKPGGRLLVVDSNLHLLPSWEAVGFLQVETGTIPFLRGYDFALWRASLAAEERVALEKGAPQAEEIPQERRFSHQPHVHSL
jgi:ubiquinone/menaquinone biosynthesis C-methylase UbiE